MVTSIELDVASSVTTSGGRCAKHQEEVEHITEANTLWKAIEYIHLNPVRRGLVERAEDWKWSSAAWFLGTGTPPLIPDRIPPEWVA